MTDQVLDWLSDPAAVRRLAADVASAFVASLAVTLVAVVSVLWSRRCCLATRRSSVHCAVVALLATPFAALIAARTGAVLPLLPSLPLDDGGPPVGSETLAPRPAPPVLRGATYAGSRWSGDVPSGRREPRRAAPLQGESEPRGDPRSPQVWPAVEASVRTMPDSALVSALLAAGILWSAGALVCLLRLLALHLRVLHRVRSLAALDRGDLHAEVFRALEALSLRRRPRILVAQGVAVPCVAGLFRPRVLVPEWLARGAPGALRAALGHEAAHLDHRDAVFNWAGAVASTVHWWNPLARGLERESAEVREHVADNVALREGSAPEVYAASLLEIAKRARSPVRPCHANGLLGRKGPSLGRRIERLLAPELDRSTRASRPRLALVAGAFAAAVIVGCSLGVRAPEAASRDSAEAGIAGGAQAADEGGVARAGPRRVLIAAARPTWDFRYLRSMLARDAGVELTIALEGEGEDLEAGSVSMEGMDTILLVDPSPRSSLLAARLPAKASEAVRRGARLIWIAGENALAFEEAARRTPLGELLPVSELFPTPEEAAGEHRIEVREEGAAELSLALGEARDELRALRLAPPRIHARPATGAVVAADSVSAGGRTAPVIVGRRVELGTSLFVGTEELWRVRGLDPVAYRAFWSALASLAMAPRETGGSSGELPVVRTWGDLLAVPRVDLDGGVAVRLGMDARTAPVGGAVLVYGLFEGLEEEDLLAGNPQSLGALRVTLAGRGDGSDPIREEWRLGLRDRAGAPERALLVRRLVIQDAAPARVVVADAAGQEVGSAGITPAPVRAHPWCMFDGSDTEAPLRLERLGEPRMEWLSAASDLPASPRFDGAFWVPPPAGVRRTVREAAPLPALVPAPGAPRFPVRVTVRSEAGEDGRAVPVIDLDADLGRLVPLERPRLQFLAGWWVNGESIVPVGAGMTEWQDLRGLQPAGIQEESRLTLRVEFLPERFGAERGDLVELELLYSSWPILPLEEGEVPSATFDGRPDRLARSERVGFRVP